MQGVAGGVVRVQGVEWGRVRVRSDVLLLVQLAVTTAAGEMVDTP